ncbi:hypothetical protein [Pectobacterium brasiliense]|uniref:hypothetical protein n=1 Tax=Pectobacterium brasiliense TaxID=180957 RepID=UPI000A5BC1B0|nr:hypothetical protein [Pectobacterium brasiliense]
MEVLKKFKLLHDEFSLERQSYSLTYSRLVPLTKQPAHCWGTSAMGGFSHFEEAYRYGGFSLKTSTT